MKKKLTENTQQDDFYSLGWAEDIVDELLNENMQAYNFLNQRFEWWNKKTMIDALCYSKGMSVFWLTCKNILKYTQLCIDRSQNEETIMQGVQIQIDRFKDLMKTRLNKYTDKHIIYS